jgi:hypothetical protein
VIVRRLTICVLAVIASAGCIVNAAPEEGASTAPSLERSTESVPLSPNSPQQPQTGQPIPAPVGEGFQIMDKPQPDPPPPRPWQPGPNANAVGASVNDQTEKPKIGGAKDDDGSKPTK